MGVIAQGKTLPGLPVAASSGKAVGKGRQGDLALGTGFIPTANADKLLNSPTLFCAQPWALVLYFQRPTCSRSSTSCVGAH